MVRWLKRGLASLLTIGLVLGLAFLAGKGGASSHRFTGVQSVAVTSYPIASFSHGEPGRSRFGPLQFIGGIELRGAHPNFGGISAIRVKDDGASFLSITDTGDWISGRIEYRGRVPVAISDVTIAPVIGPGGRNAKDMGLWDSESIALDGTRAFVGIEREHSILQFDLAQAGVSSAGSLIPMPGFVRAWPDNRGIEAIGVFPLGTPFAGRLIGLSERSGDREAPTEGFVMRQDGSEPFSFRLTRSDGFDITDLDFLPNGDLVVLERYFSPTRGAAMRLRRARTADIRPGATIDAEILMSADRQFQVDNMEGLSIHRNGSGETIFTLVSDDNFSIAQRTLLLQFRWLEN